MECGEEIGRRGRRLSTSELMRRTLGGGGGPSPKKKWGNVPKKGKDFTAVQAQTTKSVVVVLKHRK